MTSSSSPSPPCCPENSLPEMKDTSHLSNPKGTILQISNPQTNSTNGLSSLFRRHKQTMSVYCSGEQDLSKSKRILIIFSDVWGYNSGRHFELADHLVEQLNETDTANDSDSNGGGGTTVLIPDYFLGHIIAYYHACLGEKLSILTSIPITLFRLRYCDYIFQNLSHIFFPWLESKVWMANSTTNDPNQVCDLSCIGICFGGWVAAKYFSHDLDTRYRHPKFQWKCGVGIHPSFMVEQFYRLGESEEHLATSMIQKRKSHTNNNHDNENKDEDEDDGVHCIPYLFVPAKDDSDKLKPGGNVIQILSKARGVEETDISLVMEKVSHGFITRGDGSIDEDIQEAQSITEAKAVEFISRYHPCGTR